MIPNKLEGAKTKNYFKYRNKQIVSIKFNYIQLFILHFNYWHQFDNQNNRQHDPISIDRIWAKKFWVDQNLYFYLAVSAVNANLAARHFQINGELD